MAPYAERITGEKTGENWYAQLSEHKREAIRAAQRRHWRKNRDRKVLSKYGLTSEQYWKMFSNQSGLCAICDGPPTTNSNWKGFLQDPRLVVDHDHVTGKVRGLLCTSCNHVIGKMFDDPELLRRASQYVLERT